MRNMTGRPRKQGSAIRSLIEDCCPGVSLTEIGRLIGPRSNEIRAFDEAARQGKMPDARSLMGLASVLGVQVLDVLIAAAQDAGIPIDSDLDPDERRLLHLASRVPPVHRPAVINLLTDVLRFAESLTKGEVEMVGGHLRPKRTGRRTQSDAARKKPNGTHAKI